MIIRVLRLLSGYEPNLHLRCASQYRLCRPLGKLEAVIFQLRRQHGTTLIVKLFTPINSISRSGRLLIRGIILIQCIACHVLIPLGYIQGINDLLFLLLVARNIGNNFGCVGLFAILGKTMKFGTGYNGNIIT